MNVKLSPAQKISALNSEDVYKVMQQILMRENKIRRNQEHFWGIGLDKHYKILFIELISLGASNRVTVKAPEVFRMGIYKLAESMIFAHNHPSGVLIPSEADIDLTDRFTKAGAMLNIFVRDHLIISETGYFGFDSNGLMESIRSSGLYELRRKEDEELVAMKENIAKEKTEQAKASEIAKKLKAEGMDADFIKKVTGLRKYDIGKL